MGVNFDRLFGLRQQSSKGVRKHSLFGDYIAYEAKCEDITAESLAEIADYNRMWGKYLNEVSGKWGSIPTEKGFEKWLQKQMSGEKR